MTTTARRALTYHRRAQAWLAFVVLCILAALTSACGGSESAAPPPSTGGNLDGTPPVVSMTAPANLTTVSGQVSIDVVATDNVAVTRIDIHVDGALAMSLTTPPYTYQWDSTAVTDGTHLIEARARDAAGNLASASHAVTVLNTVVTPPPPADTTAPTIAITSPTSLATVSGVIAIDVNATDNVAVTSVEFRIGGTLATTLSMSPYTFAWNTTTAADGIHLVEARAYDTAGNHASNTIAVNVVNTVTPPADTTPPTLAITAPSSLSTVSGLTIISATATDNIGVVGVEIRIDGGLVATIATPPYAFTWDTTSTSNGAHLIEVRAVDAANNQAIQSLAVTVFNPIVIPPDTTPPSVAITAPLNLATVSATTTIEATASDNIGVTSVEFRINGSLAATDTASPYTFAWPTTTVTNGTHTIEVRAYDAATNQTSTSITVTVSNVAPPPSTRVVMAYAENIWGAGGAPAITSFDYSAITHVIHAFVLPEANGNLTQHANFLDFRTGGGWMPQNLPTAVHNAGKKIVMSIGGALPATNATNFAAIAANPTAKQNFISNVISSLAAWGYDGVDVDYEWPNSVIEGQQFTSLMQDLYTAVKAANPAYLVLFGAGPGDKVGYKEWAQLGQFCDYCFFFGYDWHWGYAAPHPIGPIANPGVSFTASSGPTFERSVRGAVNYVIGQGFPAAKLVIGLPFYSDSGVTWSGNGRADWLALTPMQRQNIHPSYREILINGRYWTTPEAMAAKMDALLKLSTTELRDGSNNPVTAGGVGWWEWGHENPSHGELTAAVKAWMIANP